jgi:hypothetical protein
MKNTIRILLISVLFTGMVNHLSKADIPPQGGDPGGGGGTTPTPYVTDYVEVGEVLEANGYNLSTPWQYISAQAISPSGTCEVTRVNYPIWEVKIYTQDSGTIHYDFFLTLIIEGQVKELRFITHT